MRSVPTLPTLLPPALLLALLPLALLLAPLLLAAPRLLPFAQPAGVPPAGARGAVPADVRPAVRAIDDVWWLTSAANGGRPFFSVGVNVVDQGVSAATDTASNPSYAAFRFYKSPADWARVTMRRLRSWGVNTIGGWSDDEVLQPGGAGPMAIMPVLDAGRSAGMPWTDLFAESFPARLDAAIGARVAPWRGRRDVVGFFTDNELGWWGDALFAFTLRQPEANRTRARLVQHLRDRYAGAFGRLRRDFDADAESFDALARGGTLRVAAGGEGPLVIDEFLGIVAERYYALAADAVRRHAPGSLVLGDRYVGFYEWPVVRAAAAHVDVISTNQGADWLNGETSRFYLDTLHRLSGRPVLVSEIYFAAEENRSGNRNSGALFPTVATQSQRAAGARRQLEGLAALPFVVGAHWFQYYDEPAFGRADGEDYNMGLVDIHDRPYETLIAAFSTLDARGRHARAGGARAAAAQGSSVGVPAAGVPPAAAGAPLGTWPLDRAFIASTTDDPRAGAFADAYVSWHPEGLAVAVYATGFADPAMYGPPAPTPAPGATGAAVEVPPVSQLMATIKAGADGPASSRGASKQGVPSGGTAGGRVTGERGTTVAFGPDGAVSSSEVPPGATAACARTRCWTIVTMPAARLGHTRLTAGLSIPIDVTLRYRVRTMTWRRTVRLASP